jgi:acetyltransferase-like isoleucine patch superfamily enzyme
VLKLRFGKKISLDLKQTAGFRIRPVIGNTGQLIIGRNLQTRDKLNLIIDGGCLIIGNGCFFNYNCSITCMDSVRIGDGCTFANNVVIVDHDHDYKNTVEGKFIIAPVEIGKHVWVGANSVILKGSKIGDDSVIAAGSIVRGEVSGETLYYQQRETVIRSYK